ncbi:MULTISPECIES: anthranilate synthase component I [unclassified Leifsonia]|uniref:anthranilate synthase component I n=1 Tax=unclassified Leifsonia TaxID=2663824 RepID=UPI000AA91385|nr:MULTISPECIES: anthranilate synthase component I [unclassified Leifsonia]
MTSATGTTTRETFDALTPDHRVIPVIRELFADAESPVAIYRKLTGGRPGSFLLESAEQGGIWSRYSFVGVNSFGVLTQHEDSVRWIGATETADRILGDIGGLAPLEVLGQVYTRWQTAPVDGHPPLTGGLVGFIGWEAVRQLEHLPNRPPADYEVPGQAFAFVADLVVLDHRFGTVSLIASVLNDGEATTDAAWADAQARLDALQAALAAPSEPALAIVDLTTPADPTHRVPRADYENAVEKSKHYVREGDVFQVVVSQRFDHPAEAHPLDVYRVLRSLNPSPYMYLLSLEDATGEPYWIVGSSPESLVKVQDGRTFTHPIAGSRPRGANPEEDADLEKELLADAKERAEHLMLVDLARNDLSRVCTAGTVEVTEFMRVERFSHIMHIVSSVEGDLAPGRTAIDAFRATFPAGTLSGAPKPRALEIIDELEPAQRGVYGGVVGYFGFGGDADLAIAIRTAVIAGGVAHVQAGAGLVADSDPATEYEESRTKAAAPLRAVAIANAMTRVAQ